MTDKSEESRPDDPFFDAVLDMIGRTGAAQLQIRYSDDEEPVIWMAAAAHKDKDGKLHWTIGSALHPRLAAFKLCEAIIDGGFCTYCKRPTGVTDDFDEMPLDKLVCWYQFDPELKTFRRSCEGQDK